MNIDSSIFEQEDIHDIFDAIADQVYEECQDQPFDALDEVTRNTIVLVGLDDEVSNGGFLQFMENAAGEFFPETLEAAKTIQSKGLIEALEKVANQFPNKNIPLDLIERQELLEDLLEENNRSVPFAKLDKDIQKELRANHEGAYPIEDMSFAMEETEWTKTWDELDEWYYANYETVYQDLINYLKNK